MVAVPLTARPQKDLRLTLDDNEFEMHVSAVVWTPSADMKTWQGGTPDATLSSSSGSTWVASLTVIQDYAPDSLYSFLLENEGRVVDALYRPHADEPFAILSQLTLVAPTIGGAVNEYNEATVACGSTKPVTDRTPVVEV